MPRDEVMTCRDGARHNKAISYSLDLKYAYSDSSWHTHSEVIGRCFPRRLCFLRGLKKPSYPYSAGCPQKNNEKLVMSGMGFEPQTFNVVADCLVRLAIARLF
ncbi:hypothetical protein PoB_001613200 [Plakobranchus ocellatus]|uniref:Uncharacterized protein n=1 Tax=Plakobranchus ocellatus TaxID=259542 RepID=A0AAV3Z311_9GAST|nr:hypothetical protein PoB_001613200 [Plakobranchus ocellatus]